jgi:RNA polymerase sigma-70 factor (ECF subfamily)
LRAVFITERPMLLRLLTARLGNRDAAEDALQDMWVKLAQLASGPIAQPNAYLYRMAANLAADRRLSAARGQARDGAWLDLQPLAGEQPDAERLLMARDDLRQVDAILAAMPDRMRQALRLFRIEAVSHREIAERLGISISGVEKLLKRAYRHLHDASAAAAGSDAGRRLWIEGEPES